MKTLALSVVAALSVTAVPALAEPSVERGEYIVQGPGGCGNCHTPLGPEGPMFDMDLGGRLVEQNEAFTAIAPNITPGGDVANWSDEELAKAIREGIRPDGSVIGPPMPIGLYRGLGDDDLASIVMYLRTVPAVENDPGESQYNIPLPPAYGPPIESVTAPERGVTVEYGEYLANAISHCMECHTPMGEMGPMFETDLGRGGFEFPGPWGVSVAANITPHEDGIGKYSDDQLKAIITKGEHPDGRPMFPPMPYGYFARMTPDDLDAIILYLRSLEPLPDKG